MRLWNLEWSHSSWCAWKSEILQSSWGLWVCRSDVPLFFENQAQTSPPLRFLLIAFSWGLITLGFSLSFSSSSVALSKNQLIPFFLNYYLFWTSQKSEVLDSPVYSLAPVSCSSSLLVSSITVTLLQHARGCQRGGGSHWWWGLIDSIP